MNATQWKVEEVMSKVTRRNFLVTTGIMGASISGIASASSMALTPEQTAGPFYPVKRQDDLDTDLTHIKGHKESAKGQVVEVKGRVLNSDGSVVKHAVVEVWQANASGRYDHPDDTGSSGELDPHFQGWARIQCREDGMYSFKTIKPGSYRTFEDWVRPPHIHFRVIAPGFRLLTTQLYFAGEPLNEKDRILAELTPEERVSVTVPFSSQKDALGSKTLSGIFDIVLRASANPFGPQRPGR